MKNSIFLSFLFCGLVLCGCSQPAADSTSTDAPKPDATGTTGATGANIEPTGTGATGDPAATAEMAKCAECGTEVAKTDLKDHDGKMLCAKCIAAHGH